MKITSDVKTLMVRLKRIIPADKQDQFARNIRAHFEALELDDVLGCTIVGALIGAVCEILPLDTITGINDWVEIGAAIGAWVGYARSSKERRMRREIQGIIEREVQNALAQ